MSKTLRRLELKLLRWKLVYGRIEVDPEVLPAALDWLDGEIASLENEKQLLTV
ncbi:hypothetical protein [Paenibacillus sp. Cedars]|uniref:hypothetical protein n=1 Tax=Paenibacillus sp. Cedars TaxID=1980674 RepID=UPI001561D2CE|nr:hypothetical protein [Paenibacillus sp. Cedars]